MASPELYPLREHVRRTDCYVQHDTKMTILGSQVHIMLDDIHEYKTRAEAAERERDNLRAEVEKARALLARMVAGADMWSTWEGGFPVGGDIGPAYEAAIAYLEAKR